MAPKDFRHKVQRSKKVVATGICVMMMFSVAFGALDGRSFANEKVYVRTNPNFNWFTALNSDESYEEWFRTNFRLTRKTFSRLVDIMRPYAREKKKGRKGRPLEFKSIFGNFFRSLALTTIPWLRRLRHFIL